MGALPYRSGDVSECLLTSVAHNHDITAGNEPAVLVKRQKLSDGHESIAEQLLAGSLDLVSVRPVSVAQRCQNPAVANANLREKLKGLEVIILRTS